jgi:hypothetical protein
LRLGRAVQQVAQSYDAEAPASGERKVEIVELPGRVSPIAVEPQAMPCTSVSSRRQVAPVRSGGTYAPASSTVDVVRLGA